jgi:PKD repeat protein
LTCTFTNTSSDDVGITSSAWDYDNNGSTDATTLHGSKTYSSAGTYTVKLTVTDAGGLSHFVTSTVTVAAVANIPPVANFDFSCVSKVCSFTSTSTDSDGTIASYSWNFDDGNSSTQQNPNHTYGSGSSKDVTLTVTDNSGATHSVTKNVGMSASNVSPVANFNISCTGLTCTFTNTSTDSDGSISSSAWDYDNNGSTDATIAGAGNGSKTYSAAGTYTIKLTVTDNSGSTGFITKSVTVTVPNVAPVASFTTSCSLLVCTFTNTSTDSDGSVVSSAWDYDNNGSTDATVANAGYGNKTYSSAGTYTIKLTVTDNSGGTHFTT